MKPFYNLKSLRAGLVLTFTCLLTACVTNTQPPTITIVEGVTLNQTIDLPACENLEILINEQHQVDILGLDTIKTTCLYKEWDKQRQIKGLPMALIAFPAEQKPAFITDNFMLALLSKDNLLLRIQLDTQGINAQQEAMEYLTQLLGEPSANEPATENNVWGATPKATLAAWNTNFIEAIFLGEIESSGLGSLSITSKNIYQYTEKDTPATETKEPTALKVQTPEKIPDVEKSNTLTQEPESAAQLSASEIKPAKKEDSAPKATEKIKEESVPLPPTAQKNQP